MRRGLAAKKNSQHSTERGQRRGRARGQANLPHMIHHLLAYTPSVGVPRLRLQAILVSSPNTVSPEPGIKVTGRCEGVSASLTQNPKEMGSGGCGGGLGTNQKAPLGGWRGNETIRSLLKGQGSNRIQQTISALCSPCCWAHRWAQPWARLWALSDTPRW
jgi:hypothetical protein